VEYELLVKVRIKKNMYKIEVNNNSCNGCGSCVVACPMSVLIVEAEKANPAHIEDCMCCRLCEVECPNQSIKVLDSV
jgi:2-oxoglutarate ferredoxin oxidoreductase subunit delta